MGAYKFYNPTTQQWEITKAMSIIKPNGSLEYTPDDIKAIDDKIGILTALPTTTGSANTYSVTIGGLSALTLGLKVTAKFNLANTGASTLNINGLGAKSITKAGGAALTSGNLKANGVYSLVYDGASFQLQGEGGEYGTAQASHVLSGYTVGTDSGIITGTIPSKGAATITPTTSNQTIAAGQYLSGVQTIAGVTVPVANVLTGTTIAGAAGTMPNRGAVTNALTTQGGAYTIPAGYHSGAGKVIAIFANLVAGNIKSGVNIGGVVGNLIEGARFVTGTVASNELAWNLVITTGFKPMYAVYFNDVNSRNCVVIAQLSENNSLGALVIHSESNGTRKVTNQSNLFSPTGVTFPLEGAQYNAGYYVIFEEVR